MSLLHVYGAVILFVLAFMTTSRIASLIFSNSSIVDPMWSTGLVLSNWVGFVLSPDGFPARKWLISILVILWGTRLSVHLFRPNWGTGEDFRYQQWRQQAGPTWWWYSYFKVSFAHGLVMCALATAPVAAQVSPTRACLTVFDLAAIPVWASGFFFDTVGDCQLSGFLVNPANKGKLLDTGLWCYTRHPNYFGEATMWRGHHLVALSTPGGFLSIVSPSLITRLLVRVPGVTLLGKSMVDTTPRYKESVETTSAFVPCFTLRRG